MVGVYQGMKLIAVAFLSSIVTALLVLVIVEERLSASPPASFDTLTVKELRVLDETGAVRVRLGTHNHWSPSGSPALEMLTAGAEHAGIELYLNDEGKGTLLFNSKDTEAKVMVGHFLTGDVLPASQSDHSWGMRILNLNPVKDAPYDLHIAATEIGNVYVSGVTIKQGLPPDAKPMRADAP